MNDSSLINICMSEAVVGKVTVHIFKTVVPIQDAVTIPYSPEPCYAEIHYILKMPSDI